ncbi:hypothetical protein V8G54_007594, partial [Vigna mungo]
LLPQHQSQLDHPLLPPLPSSWPLGGSPAGSQNTNSCLFNKNSISLFCLSMRPKEFGLLSLDSEPHTISPTVTSSIFTKALGPTTLLSKVGFLCTINSFSPCLYVINTLQSTVTFPSSTTPPSSKIILVRSPIKQYSFIVLVHSTTNCFVFHHAPILYLPAIDSSIQSSLRGLHSFFLLFHRSLPPGPFSSFCPLPCGSNSKPIAFASGCPLTVSSRRPLPFDSGCSRPYGSGSSRQFGSRNPLGLATGSPSPFGFDRSVMYSSGNPLRFDFSYSLWFEAGTYSSTVPDCLLAAPFQKWCPLFVLQITPPLPPSALPKNDSWLSPSRL